MNKDDKKKCNPKLIFRITDVNLNIDATTNMHQMLLHQDDQFQSIRDCINELFDEPFAINTNNLDRTEFKLLKEEDFIGILSEKENGFNNAITKINDYLSCCSAQRTISSFYSDVLLFVQCINNDKRIDFKELDVVSNLAIRNIMYYINNIDNEMYKDIIVDGTQKTYEDNLVSRIAKRDEIIQDIYKKWNSIPKNIIDNEIPQFTNKINPLIETATKENLEKAQVKLKDIIDCNFDGLNQNGLYKIQYIFGNKDNFDDILINYMNFIDDLEKIFEKITKVAKLLFKDVYELYINKKDNIFKTLTENFGNIGDLIKVSVDKCKEDMNKFIDETIMNIYDIIIDLFDIETHDKLESYYNGIIENKTKQIQKNILKSDTYENKQIVFNVTINIDDLTVVTNNTIINKKNNESSYFTELNMNYKKLFEEQMKTKEEDICKMLIDKREQMLTEEKGKIETLENVDKIIINNPDIIFVKFILHNKTYTMTQKYFEQTLKEDLKQICEICIKESYQNDWSKFMKEITNIKIVENTKVFIIDFNEYKEKCDENYSKLVLFELFELEFKKYFARKKFTFEF
jgi:hypothetical protein